MERYPFRDHGVPELATLFSCTTSAKQWLEDDPKNVVCFHCKVGTYSWLSISPQVPNYVCMCMLGRRVKVERVLCHAVCY